MLVTQFDKFVNRSTQEILGSEIERENLVPMLSTDIRNVGGVTGVKGNAEIYYRTGNVNLTPADLGALNTDNVYNGLDEMAAGYALDARQGKVLNESIDDKLDKANVYNGLDETAGGYALDARQGKVLNDKINATQSDIAIIIEGNQTTHTGGVAIGDFVLVRNSTISGITNGLYKAVQAIPANIAIDSTYLAAVDGGGLNVLNSNIVTFYEKNIPISSVDSYTLTGLTKDNCRVLCVYKEAYIYIAYTRPNGEWAVEAKNNVYGNDVNVVYVPLTNIKQGT